MNGRFVIGPDSYVEEIIHGYSLCLHSLQLFDLLLILKTFIMETPGLFQHLFEFMGPWRWPLILLSVLVLVFIVLRVNDYFFRKPPVAKNPDAIMLWGSITAAMGLLGQVAAIWAALNAIMVADDISPVIVLIGFYSSFSTTFYGLMVLIVAAVCWWGLKWKYRMLKAVDSGNNL